MDPDPISLFLPLASFDFITTLNGFFLIALLICSALISGAEVALLPLTKANIDEGLENKSVSIDRAVIKLVQKMTEKGFTVLIIKPSSPF